MIDLKTLMTADMTTIVNWIDRGGTWWGSQLRAIFGPSSKRSHLIAELNGERLVCREFRAGAALPLPRIGKPEELLPQMVFALPAEQVLVHEVVLPSLAYSELRRLIALDMDRITPLRSDEVVFDLEPGEALAGNRRRFSLGIARRSAVLDVLERLRTIAGVEPRAISLVEEEGATPRFDLLKALRGTVGNSGRLSARSLWWVAAGALIAANIGMFVLRDMAALQALRDEVEAQRPMAATAAQLRRRVEAENIARQVLLERRIHYTPLPLLAAVTRALPDSAYVQRFEWNGSGLHLVGRAQAGTNVIAALTSANLFQSVRPSAPDLKMAEGSFDIVAIPKSGYAQTGRAAR